MTVFNGELPVFDPAAGIADNASDLCGLLSLQPSWIERFYREFEVDKQSYSGTPVTTGNADLVLLLHFINIIRDRSGVGPETIKKMIRDYCGPGICADESEHPLGRYVHKILGRQDIWFKLKKTSTRF